MGWGDALITTALARQARDKHPDKIICPGNGAAVIWDSVYDGNPNLSKEPQPGCVWIHNYKGHRPYIASQTATHYTYNYKFKVTPGELYLTDDEAYWNYSDFVYIEPNIKGWLGPNKDWGFANWQETVDSLEGVNFVQGPGRKLNGVEQVETRSFRHACGLLAKSKLFVGTDGGLHHAAAALGIPAIVIWTGFSPWDVLGYDDHVNIHPGTNVCGKLHGCPHCERGARSIKPYRVIDAIRRQLTEFHQSRVTYEAVPATVQA